MKRMITVKSNGLDLALNEVGYHPQDDPYPGGVQITILLTDQQRTAFQKKIRSVGNLPNNVHAQIYVFEWLMSLRQIQDTGQKRYVLNKIDSVEYTDEEVVLHISASPLVPLADFPSIS